MLRGNQMKGQQRREGRGDSSATVIRWVIELFWESDEDKGNQVTVELRQTSGEFLLLPALSSVQRFPLISTPTGTDKRTITVGCTS